MHGFTIFMQSLPAPLPDAKRLLIDLFRQYYNSKMNEVGTIRDHGVCPS